MGIITANHVVYNREKRLLRSNCPSVSSGYLNKMTSAEQWEIIAIPRKHYNNDMEEN